MHVWLHDCIGGGRDEADLWVCAGCGWGWQRWRRGRWRGPRCRRAGWGRGRWRHCAVESGGEAGTGRDFRGKGASRHCEAGELWDAQHAFEHGHGAASGQGILAAADWITSEFEGISKECGGCLEVKRDEFMQPASNDPRSRVTKPTKLVNVYAILHGTGGEKAPWVLVTGHYDSRATDVMNDKLTSPGANDDASGVAVSLESARAMARLTKAG